MSNDECGNAVSDAMIDPPIQTASFLSGRATILLFIVAGAHRLISFLIRSDLIH
jgi:hypothetical protein